MRLVPIASALLLSCLALSLPATAGNKVRVTQSSTSTAVGNNTAVVSVNGNTTVKQTSCVTKTTGSGAGASVTGSFYQSLGLLLFGTGGSGVEIVQVSTCNAK